MAFRQSAEDEAMAEEMDWKLTPLEKLRIKVQEKRVRLYEHFQDFDTLRKGFCTAGQVKTVFTILNIGKEIDRSEFEQVLNSYSRDDGMFCYRDFCADMDREPEAPYIDKSSSPSTTQLMSFKPSSQDEEDKFLHLMHRVAALCRSRGIIFKYCFTDMDRSPTASPSRTNPYYGGKVNKSQFIRHFPFKKEFAIEELDFLARHYSTDSGDVHFMAMHNDISDVPHHEPPPFPRSDLILRPDEAEWSQSKLSPVEKLRAKVLEKRVRLYEHFQDFDPLRKGYCTASQVKTVFTVMNLGKEIDRSDFEILVNSYLREDGMFCYKDFVADIDREFTVPFLEKEPLLQVSMPDANSTLPARRNRMSMTPARLQKVQELEEKIRWRVRTRRIHMMPAFQDMDRVHTGHITRNQFARVMYSMGFELDEVSVGLLCSVYCDLGNHTDFNYVDFMKSVDAPGEDVELAIMQASAPFQDPGIPKYFDERGRVQPLMARSAVLA